MPDSSSSRRAQGRLFSRLSALLSLLSACSDRLQDLHDGYHDASSSHRKLLRECSAARVRVLESSEAATRRHLKAKEAEALEGKFDEVADEVVAGFSRALIRSVREGRKEGVGVEERVGEARRKLGVREDEGVERELDERWVVLAEELAATMEARVAKGGGGGVGLGREEIRARVLPLIMSLYAVRMAIEARIEVQVAAFADAVRVAAEAVGEHKDLVTLLNVSADELRDLKELERAEEIKEGKWAREEREVILGLAKLRMA